MGLVFIGVNKEQLSNIQTSLLKRFEISHQYVHQRNKD